MVTLPPAKSWIRPGVPPAFVLLVSMLFEPMAMSPAA